MSSKIFKRILMRIQQGDQYAIPFPVYIGDELASPANVAGVRIKIHDTMSEYPDGDLTYDADRGVWQYPLTEENTRSWPVSELKAQVGVKLDSTDFRYCPTFLINLEPNIITDTWAEAEEEEET